MTIYHGMNFVFLSVFILLVGMIKPQWVLFWVDNPKKVKIRSSEVPGRFIIAFVCLVLFMIGMVMFGEGNKHAALQKQPVATQARQTVDDKPTPEKTQPVMPAQAPDTSANELRP